MTYIYYKCYICYSMMINNKNIKKFSADKEYWWIFRSNEIFEIENENGHTFTVRWEYENHSKFSNYDKPRTEWGERANFVLSLVYKTEISGKECWLDVIDNYGEYNFATKKEMLERLDYMMDVFNGIKDNKFYPFKIKK